MKIIIANTNIGALLKASDAILGKNKDVIPERIKGQATLSWIKSNFGKSFFSMCNIDNLASMNDVCVSQERMDFFRTLHCVHYSEMTAETKDYLFATLVDLFRGNIVLSNSSIS